MSNTQRRITMNDIEAVGYGKLLLAAIIGIPVGTVLAFIFAVVWLALLPAGQGERIISEIFLNQIIF